MSMFALLEAELQCFLEIEACQWVDNGDHINVALFSLVCWLLREKDTMSITCIQL